MPLSDHEQRMLDQIESELSTETLSSPRASGVAVCVLPRPVAGSRAQHSS
jgi:Protein of unknown function (DUF3040)